MWCSLCWTEQESTTPCLMCIAHPNLEENTHAVELTSMLSRGPYGEEASAKKDKTVVVHQ